MALKTPIYSIAKELNIDSKKVIQACKHLGIYAKGSTKKLNEEETKKVKSYFEKGKNVSQEIIDLKRIEINSENRFKRDKENNNIKYFGNRLTRKP